VIGESEPAAALAVLRYAPGTLSVDPDQHSSLAAGCFQAVAQRAIQGLGPTVSRTRSLAGVGEVRLDHPDVVARWAGRAPDRTPHLELVLAAIESRGPECIAELLGDFAFVVWNAASREIIAARDAFGVHTLYYRQDGDVFALSSRASLLATSGGYNPEFIATYLTIWNDPAEPSPFVGVTTVPSGCILKRSGRSCGVSQYWDASQFPIAAATDERAQIGELRSLFTEGVRTRIASREDIWAQLSGGLDSSSVVCMAQLLARQGLTPSPLGGTITLVDGPGLADEREFSDAVVRAHELRNEQVEDHWPWRDDGLRPPLLETPHANYPFYARDRRACTIIREAGGRVLLTGIGSDQYLSSLPYFFADWIVERRWRRACRGMTRWAVLDRSSFWNALFQFGLIPLLPRALRRRLAPRHLRVAPWVQRRFARRFAMERRDPTQALLDAPWGQKFAGGMINDISHFGRYSDQTLFTETFDVRHPFLYRPLVEFSLRLAPELRVRPLAQKWILREAMRGVLPESIRTRTDKGAVDSRYAWALSRERERIDDLTRAPILADLGCIDGVKLRAAIEAARRGREIHIVPLITTLSLETWLRARSGEWAVRESAPQRAYALA
jgi:asparagine synthase (glutamine-hydrolysing)